MRAMQAQPRTENNILQLSAAMAMPCASGKLSYRHGLEPLEFGEFGRIAVVTGSGSMEERWAAAKLGIWHSKSVWRKGGIGD